MRPACITQLVQVGLLRRRLRLAQIEGASLPNSLLFNGGRYRIASCLSGSSVEILELILKHANGLEIQLAAPDTALYTAAKNGHLNAVQIILTHANNPSIRSTSSQLLGHAVIMSASVGDEQTVKALLSLDDTIEPNGPSGLGRALSLAAEGGFTRILEQIFHYPTSRRINRHGEYSLGLAHSNAVTHLQFLRY